MTCDGLLYRSWDLVINDIGIDFHVLHLDIHDYVETWELDLGAEGFASVKYCKNQLWDDNTRRSDLFWPNVAILRAKGHFWSHNLTECVPKSLKTASDSVWVAATWDGISLLYLSFFTFLYNYRVDNSILLTFNPICKLIEGLFGERKLSTSKELSHLIIDELAGVTKSSLVLKVVTSRRYKISMDVLTYNMKSGSSYSS